MIPNTKNENDSKQSRQLLHNFEFSMSTYEIYKPFSSNFLSKNRNIQYVKYACNNRTLHKKWSFPLRSSSIMWPNPQFLVDLVTFTEEILNENLHFLCSDSLQRGIIPLYLILNTPILITPEVQGNIQLPFFPRPTEDKNRACIGNYGQLKSTSQAKYHLKDNTLWLTHVTLHPV